MSEILTGISIPEHYVLIFARRLLNFTDELVKEHFDQHPPYAGQTLILSMQQHNMNRYRLVKVVNPASGRQKRIIIDHSESFGGASYYRSGKSGFAPKGQTRLLPYVEAVAERLSFDRDTVLTDEVLLELLPPSALME
ncbi:hypothetical protein [Pseudomonas serbica]|uniref:hypothetical protein n=1 Tax=Pseudomonas serbica TaxID=2965074 RepID=UPI00237A1464|nr:hypothetical protein [Pseudomonas serbica]